MQRAYRMRPTGALVVAALLAAIALAGIFLGKFGSAGSGRRAGVGAAAESFLDALPLIWQYGLAYGFLACLLALAAAIAFTALRGKPALVLSSAGVTTHSLLLARSIGWDEIETVEQRVAGFVTLSGRGKSVPIALDMMIAPQGEIMGLITAALAARSGVQASSR